ncbi:hypothetical protein JCM15519_11100 [Fundidesulfovibrio butyratiphilus]
MVKNIACLLGAIFVLILVEVALRFLVPPENQKQTFVPSLFTAAGDKKNFVVEYDEALGYRIKTHGDADTFVDSLGRSFQKTKPAGVFRILCLGGSTTYGVGAEAEFSYPVILQDLLTYEYGKPGSAIEVINAGVMGYHSWHSVLRAALELDALQPDVYILMDGVNDFYASQSVKNMSSLEDEKKALVALVNSRDKKPTVLSRVESLCENLASYRLLKTLVRHPVSDKASVAERLERFGYRSNMARFIEDKKSKGVDVVLVDYPWIYNFITPHRKVLNYTYRVDQTMMSEASRYFHTTNTELGAQYHVPVVDMQTFFNALMDKEPDINRIYTDNVHLSKYSNFLLAQCVAGALRSDPAFAKAFPGKARTLDASGHPLLKLYSWGKRIGPFGWLPLDTAIATRIVETRGIEAVRDSGLEGWSYQYPVNGPGSVRLSFRTKDAVQTGGVVRCFFYPRITRVDSGSVTVAQIFRDGRKQTVFQLDPSNEYAVQCAQTYFFDAQPDEGEVCVEVTLSGESQLWYKGDRYLFQVPPFE